MNKNVTILPINKRLKQLIKVFGSTWKLLQHKASVQCFNNEGWLIESLDKKHRRWVRKEELKKEA